MFQEQFGRFHFFNCINYTKIIIELYFNIKAEAYYTLSLFLFLTVLNKKKYVIRFIYLQLCSKNLFTKI